MTASAERSSSRGCSGELGDTEVIVVLNGAERPLLLLPPLLPVPPEACWEEQRPKQDNAAAYCPRIRCCTPTLYVMAYCWKGDDGNDKAPATAPEPAVCAGRPGPPTEAADGDDGVAAAATAAAAAAAALS